MPVVCIHFCNLSPGGTVVQIEDLGVLRAGQASGLEVGGQQKEGGRKRKSH